MNTVIAIDGPAASGKSSVARRLSSLLGFAHVNSGSFYRMVTWWVIQEGLDPAAGEDVSRQLAAIPVEAGFVSDQPFFHLHGRDYSAFVKEDAVNQSVSLVSRIPAVREIVTTSLRSLADRQALIMEGRDIGSVVFPQTPFKFYIDASPEVRAQRRAAEGQRDDLATRDRTDSSRPNAPLTIAADAAVIDSTHLSIEGVVDAIVDQLKARGLALPVR